MLLLSTYPGARNVEVAKQVLLTILRAEQRPDVTSRFPFQRLPPEIRNAIYHLHLVQPEDPTCLSRWNDSLEARARAKAYYKAKHPEYVPPPYEYTALSVLGVSRQLHEEALGIFYYHNTFYLEHVAALRDFLNSIGPRRRNYIRDIKFYYCGTGSPAAFKSLAACQNLTNLHIEVSAGTLVHSKRDSLLSSWGVSHLLKIRGLETVEISDLSDMPDEFKEGFEETVRNALLLPREAIMNKKPAANPKASCNGKNVAAGTKRTIGGGEASRGKKTKLSMTRIRA